jgi:hypothetical protein
MARLWKRFGGEPYLINPHLISLNPKSTRRKNKMAKRRALRRGASGRFMKANPRKRRHVRRHLAAPRRVRRVRRSYAMNPPRRRRRSYKRNAYFGNPVRRRRSYRRNPIISGSQVFGVKFSDILYAGGGFIAPPLVEGFIKGYLPTSITGNAFGKYALKAATVYGLSWAGKKFISQEAGKYIAIGGIVYIVANLVIDFVPQLFSGFSGYMSPGPTFSALPRNRWGYGAHPLMGMYNGIGTAPGKLPERVDPNARF